MPKDRSFTGDRLQPPIKRLQQVLATSSKGNSVFNYIKKIINALTRLLQVDHPLICSLRQGKDFILKPLVILSAKLRLSPTVVTAAVLVFGLISFKFLFSH